MLNSENQQLLNNLLTTLKVHQQRANTILREIKKIQDICTHAKLSPAGWCMYCDRLIYKDGE